MIAERGAPGNAQVRSYCVSVAPANSMIAALTRSGHFWGSQCPPPGMMRGAWMRGARVGIAAMTHAEHESRGRAEDDGAAESPWDRKFGRRARGRVDVGTAACRYHRSRRSKGAYRRADICADPIAGSSRVPGRARCQRRVDGRIRRCRGRHTIRVFVADSCADRTGRDDRSRSGGGHLTPVLMASVVVIRGASSNCGLDGHTPKDVPPSFRTEGGSAVSHRAAAADRRRH